MDRLIQLIKQWQTLQPLSVENQKRLDEKFRLEFNFNSNHLEGNTLTYGETKLLLLFDQTKGSHELREYEEMKAHDVALKMIKDEAVDKERPLTENFIRLLNQTILVRPFWKEAVTPNGQITRRKIIVGDYKKHPNSVIQANGEVFEYASPQETPALMTDLVQWYNTEVFKAEMSPIELASLLHYKYIRIHPFDDGNGRIARLLVNYVLFRNNLPPIIIKTSDKKEYLRTLQQADSGYIDVFVDYMENQLIWSLDIVIRAAKGESIDEPDDLDKKLYLLKRELGELPEENIKVHYSDKAVSDVTVNVLFPLLHAWEKKLQEFEPLFLDRGVSLNLCRNTSKNDFFKDTNFSFLIEKVKSKLRLLDIIKIVSLASFKGLRRIDNNVSVNAGAINIEFHRNAYEIKYTGCKKVINKLYHQILTDDEINTIVLSLGNFLYDNIKTVY